MKSINTVTLMCSLTRIRALAPMKETQTKAKRASSSDQPSGTLNT